ncbi:MAG: hypothetical protein DRJ29_13640 [Bacteroidetes bacterium]|nr:MAG: hypothetical protein DRJ29_13640 [Bacteroidota bacterium]
MFINSGPKSGGTIPAIQSDRLNELGDWMKVNGIKIYFVIL